MGKDEISLKQYLILVTVGLQPVLVKLVPRGQIGDAFRGAWLGPLAALMPMLILVGIIGAVGNSLSEGSGLGELLCLCCGKKLGRGLCGVYGLWLMVTACAALRFCAERFVSTIYPDTELGLFLLVLSGIVWQLNRKGLAAAARVGELFLYLIMAMLVLILALVLGKVHLYNIWPVWTQDVPGVMKAGGGVLSAMGTAVGTLFLLPQTVQRRGGTVLAAKWVSGVCLVLAAEAVVLLGTFGPDLVGRMQIPFFSLAKEVQPERLESVVAAVWVFTDLILIAVLLYSAKNALSMACGEEVPGLESALVLIMLPGAYLLADSSIAMERVLEKWSSIVEMVLALAVPLLSIAVGKIRKVI